MAFDYNDKLALRRIETKVDTLTNLVTQLTNLIKKEGERSMAETDAGTSMGLLLDKISDDLDALKATLDPTAQAKVDEAIAKITANKDAWVAKVLANTTAAPTP